MRENENISNFAERLKKARNSLGLTQPQLAERWAFDPNYIYLLESGRKPISKKVIPKISELEDEVRARQLEKLEPEMLLKEAPSLRQECHRYLDKVIDQHANQPHWLSWFLVELRQNYPVSSGKPSDAQALVETAAGHSRKSSGS